ncbi:MAG: glycosyltransferase family 2 protein [Flavobacteriales bacterium]|nr:glycosyltransferase family 2 protein [Flavobacteriales bacterium]
MLPRTWVVVVTYNAMRWADRCFGSLRAVGPSVHAVVVDNGSSDGTVEHLRTAFPEVEVIEAGGNIGFGQANNKGLARARAASAEHVFLLNQDAWVLPGTIPRLVSVAAENPGFGILSPMHLNGAGDALDYNFSCAIEPKRCSGLYSDIYLGRAADKVYTTRFVNAAAWLVARKCLETVGGFDPLFFHYGEDDNYVGRVHYHGFKVGVLPSAVIHHDREQRDGNLYFDEERTWKARRLKLRFADPGDDADPVVERMGLRRKMIRSLLTMDMNAARIARDGLKLLDEANVDEAVRHRAIVREPGPHFL